MIVAAGSSAGWLRGMVPEALRHTGFLLEHWQWLGLLALSVLGFVVDKIVTAVIPGLVRRSLRRRDVEIDRAVAARAWRPFGVLAMALAWLALLPALEIGGPARTVLDVAIRFFAAAAGVWTAYRLVDLTADALDRRAAATRTKFDDLLVPLFRKSFKVFVTLVGLVFIANAVGIEVTSLLAGLGLGGLAFALAAQDTVKNLFGSLTVIFDRPFHVGDWVVIGDTEGTVEEVGFRSTRVRTFYDSLVTIPNGNLISAVVDNMGSRRYRRVKTMLSLAYSTPAAKVESFCEAVRELVRLHPYTKKDGFHVYLNRFSASSIDVLLYVFVRVPDWATELRERQRLFLDILRVAERLGVEFAFPTRTVHLMREGRAPDEDDSPAPPGETADSVDGALAEGRRQAREIVTELLGDPPRRPPPPGVAGREPESRGNA